MWSWLREALRKWLMQGSEHHQPPSAQAPPPAMMQMLDVGSRNVQVGPLEHATMARVGDGNVQIGDTEAKVVVQQITHNHFHAAAQAPLVSPAAASPPRPVQRASAHQRQILALMKATHCERAVLRWMQGKFGTQRVVELEGPQLKHLENYCRKIISNAQVKHLEEMGR